LANYTARPMATSDTAGRLTVGEESEALARSLRSLTRSATIVAVLSFPALFLFYYHVLHWAWYLSLLISFTAIVAFRGLLDIIIRRIIPWPTLFGTSDVRLTEEDIVNRRRSWFWKRKYAALIWIGILVGLVYGFIWVLLPALGVHINWSSPTTIAILLQLVF